MGNLVGRLGLLAVALSVSGAAYGQAEVTASQAMELSAFGAGTVTWTGLEQSRNAAFTAGVDLAFRPFFGVRPALEIRGTYPFNQGEVVGEKSGLVGARFSKTYHRFNPYVDVLYGRGELTYVGGFIVGTFRYDRTTTNVFAGGGGIDFSLTPHFDIKADAQIERWSTPVTSSGTLYSTPVSLGVVYRFDFNHHARMQKTPKARPEPVAPLPPPPPPTTPDAGVTVAPAASSSSSTDAAPAATTPPPATTPAPSSPGNLTGTSNPPPNF